MEDEQDVGFGSDIPQLFFRGDVERHDFGQIADDLLFDFRRPMLVIGDDDAKRQGHGGLA